MKAFVSNFMKQLPYGILIGILLVVLIETIIWFSWSPDIKYTMIQGSETDEQRAMVAKLCSLFFTSSMLSGAIAIFNFVLMVVYMFMKKFKCFLISLLNMILCILFIFLYMNYFFDLDATL